MVHQYQLNGYNIVLDTCSGSVHVVDDVAYDVIAMYKEHSADEIVAAMLEKYGDRPDVTEADLRQCLEDVASLEQAGKLWSPDTYADMAFDFKNRNTVVKALCLHVAHTCNLNCSYCFASQGRYQGDRALMSFEVGKRAMDFLIENSGTRRNLEVDFFGGEPLMNFDMVKKLVAYCREQEKIHNKNFRFTMTTNGMLIDDDVIDFCNKECHNVVLSLDGRKEVHDRFRKDYAGHGSYDTIVPKFQKFVEKRGDKGYYMRGTYTHFNTDFTNDIFHMADLGFTELSREPEVHITDIDIDETACALARRSAEANGLADRIRVVQADLRRREQLPPGGSFDVCVANPPYFPPHTGRVAEGSRGVQRAELQCTMDELCAAAAYLLRSGGRLYLIHRAERTAELTDILRRHRLEPKELRFVQKDSRTPPRLVLLGCRRDGGTGLTVRTPLLLQDEHGGESQELRRIYFRDRG